MGLVGSNPTLSATVGKLFGHNSGEVPERSKGPAWKAGVGDQTLTAGSNPALSATPREVLLVIAPCNHPVREGGIRTGVFPSPPKASARDGEIQ